MCVYRSTHLPLLAVTWRQGPTEMAFQYVVKCLHRPAAFRPSFASIPGKAVLQGATAVSPSGHGKAIAFRALEELCRYHRQARQPTMAWA